MNLMCTPKDFGNLCKCFNNSTHKSQTCFPYILVWKSVPIFRISLVLMILPLFSLFNIKSLRYPSVHYALLQERALGSMQVYHFITLPFQRSILQSLFFNNLFCNLNHPCMQHYTLKSDNKRMGLWIQCK